MLAKKIIPFTIFGSFFVLGYIDLSTASTFTAGQYVGKWFIIGITVPDSPKNYNMTSCVWYEVKKRVDSNTSFNEVHHLKIINGRWIHDEGYGRVLDRYIHIIHPNWNTRMNIYIISSFNGQGEMVLHSKTEKLLNLLISRTPKISRKVKAKFERLAQTTGVHTVYFPHDQCVYES